MGGSGSTSDNCDCDLPTTPVKKVRIIIHVFLDNNGLNNIPNNSSGNTWLNGIVADANVWMRNLATYDVNSSASVYDSRIEYDLIAKYWWNNTTMNGKSSNSIQDGADLYNFVMAQNNPSVAYKHNAIHVLIPGDDSSSDKPQKGRACGNGCKNWTLFTNTNWKYLHNNTPTTGYGRWSTSGLLRHELGHNLRLIHSYSLNDGCSDTPPVSSNNIMHEPGGLRNALTQCQAGRMHHWLNTTGSGLLSSGNETPNLTGTISSSGYYGPLVCCTQNVSATDATVNVTAPGVPSLTWTKTGGTGNLSVNSNGSVLTLSNLGSINLKVEWTKNCINYSRTYTLYNGGSFLMSGPNPVDDLLAVELVELSEWQELTGTFSGERLIDTWELFDDKGKLVKYQKEPGQETKFDISFKGLKPGLYTQFVKKSEIAIERKILKM